MIHKITKILSVYFFEIKCEFDHDQVKKIEVADWILSFKELKNSWTSKLAHSNCFKTIKLADYGTICWDNEVDFYPNTLFVKSSLI